MKIEQDNIQSLLYELKEKNGLSQPNSQYSTPAMYNWIKSLVIIIESSDDFCHNSLSDLYKKENRLNFKDDGKLIALTYENILMSLNYYSALKALASFDNLSDTLINGVISWYYCIYNLSKAMITANKKGFIDPNHGKVASNWTHDFSLKKKIPAPFDLSVTNLAEEKELRNSYKKSAQLKNYNLFKTPEGLEQAEIGNKMYLCGLLKYKREDIEKSLKKNHKLNNFRTNKAKAILEEKLTKTKPFGFLNMAFRYRGKANYRDALFLTYYPDGLPRQKELLLNLIKTSEAFMKMTSYYLYYKLPKGCWHSLLNDSEVHSNLTEKGDYLFYDQNRN